MSRERPKMAIVVFALYLFHGTQFRLLVILMNSSTTSPQLASTISFTIFLGNLKLFPTWRRKLFSFFALRSADVTESDLRRTQKYEINHATSIVIYLAELCMYYYYSKLPVEKLSQITARSAT